MSEQERGLTDNEIMGILKGAVKTAITYEAADAILATISILRNEIVGLKAEVARSQNIMFAAMEGMRSQGREGFGGFIAEIANAQTPREQELETKLLAAVQEISTLKAEIVRIEEDHFSSSWDRAKE